VTSSNQFDESYKNAEFSTLQQFYDGPEIICNYTGVVPEDLKGCDAITETFKTALAAENKQIQVIVLSNLILDLETHRYKNIATIKKLFISLFSVLLDFERENDIEPDSGFSSAEAISQFVSQAITLAQLKDSLLNELHALKSNLERKHKYSRKSYDVIKYVRQHFDDSNLSIGEIADSSYVSINYLCSLFKKETGNTINRFITDYRIAKSKELLRDHSIKLYEVASHIGIADPDYFTKLFKKYEGCTPSEYREKS
jgi:two-component system response regulator YesN